MLFVKCACELRSPTQFTDAGFVAFNRHYVERLAARGIFREEVNLALKKRIDAIKDEAIRRRLKWDHEFESAFLQPRVSKLSVPQRCSPRPHHFAACRNSRPLSAFDTRTWPRRSPVEASLPSACSIWCSLRCWSR